MGIDLSLYRSRIGCFTQVVGRQKSTKCSEKYKSISKGPDVHLRTFITGWYLLCIVLTTYSCLLGQNYLASQNLPPYLSAISESYVPYGYSPITSSNYGVQYESFAERILLLGGDVELNPGPVTPPSEETRMILKAISDSNKQMSSELSAVRAEFKAELKRLNTDLKEVKSKVEHIDKNTAILDQRVSDIEMSFEHFEHRNEHYFNQLTTQRDADNERIEIIEQQLNQIESDKMKCSLRVFGLAEQESESKSLMSVIGDEVVPLVDSSDIGKEQMLTGILSATRIGKVSHGKPRMVIVKFKSVGDKRKWFDKRDALRAKGIRISNDLSFQQRQLIKIAYDQGYNAYFRNGKLVKESMPNRYNNRDQKRGVRTLDDRNRQQLKRQSNNGDPQAETREVQSDQSTNGYTT